MSNNLENSYLSLVEFLLLSKHQLTEIAAQYGLTAMQGMTLVLLDIPRPMTYLKNLFACDPSNVTGLVDGLEQKQLATRSEDANDRRIKMVQLQAAGRRLRSQILKDLTGPNSYITTKLSPDEVDSFVRLIQKISAD